MLQIYQPSFVTVSGWRMAYTEIWPRNPNPNSKETVLLITGLACSRLSWNNQMEEFGQLYHTIALDNRDVGDSDHSDRAYTVADMADDTASFLRSLKIKNAYVVGISMGGFIALELTLRHPELVSKLVLASTSGGGLINVPASPRLLPGFLALGGQNFEPFEKARRVYTLITGPGYVTKNSQIIKERTSISTYKPTSPGGYTRQLRACLLHNVISRLDRIKVPTLVIHGDKDPVVSVANGKRLARKIRGAKLCVYPDVGHLPIIEEAERFNRDVLTFLAHD